MDGLLQLTWRAYPASVLIGLGVLLILSGQGRCRAAWRGRSGTMEPLAWMRGFRLTVLGAALIGIGAGWIWQIGWLLAVCTVVGLEETLESSLAIAALSGEPRIAAGHSPR